MAVAFGPPSCSSGLVPESKLSHSPEAQSGFVPKHSLHGGKNPALRAEKPLSDMRSLFLVKRSVTVFFASDDVFSCKATSADVVACAGACSQAQSHDISTKARRAKTTAEGFLRPLSKSASSAISARDLKKMFFRFEEPVFLLSLISKHEMRRMRLVMTDGSSLPIRQHQ